MKRVQHALVGGFVLVLASASPLATQTVDDDRRPGQVTIYRDDYGVPHIYASTEEEAFYGLGYAQAEDQLEFVLELYLVVRGERAAAFGGELVPADLKARQWMHVEESKAGYQRLTPQLKKNNDFYTAGLKRYMRDHPDEVPEWAPEPEPWDPIMVSRGLYWNYMAGDGFRDCQRGGVQLSALTEAALLEHSRAASNEWVLAPWRTADDAMIVLIDPHGPIDGTWAYEFRIDAGRLKSAGYSMGPATLSHTHTRYVSWGMTAGAPDVADCYEVEVDPTDPRRYRFDSEWKTMVTRDVSIAVKDGDAVTRTFEYTRHNDVLSPVVARANGKAYVVSTPYMHDAGAFDQEVYEINLAQNVGEVREAMRRLGMFASNLMFGDRDGRSLYVRAGRTPKRPAGFDWTRPVPGNSSESAWDGLHPVDDLVIIESPPQGYMQNNNISPDVMMEDSPATADKYPAYIFNDRADRNNTRGMRAVEVLSSAMHFTVEDAVDLALDERWVGFNAWQRALRDALAHHLEAVRGKAPAFRQFVQRILRFDGDARAGSVEALNFYYWRSALSSGLSDEQLRNLVRVLWGDEDLNAELGEALIDQVDRAVEMMVRRHGTTDLAYGEVFRIGRDERTPLYVFHGGGRSRPRPIGRDERTWPLGGGAIREQDRRRCSFHPLLCINTLRNFRFAPPDSLGQRRVVGGSRLLKLVIFTDPIQSFTLHNFGQSAHTDSPHYVDQARLSSQRMLKPVYFEKSELMRHVTSTLTLDVSREP